MADLFEQSEGTRADLKNLLSLALQRVECNIYLAQLMIWIFNTSDTSKPLRKSYPELASRPWGLCCSPNQAYSTVKKAKLLGLIKVVETWAGPGTQGPNEYSIDWDGVRRIVGLRQVAGYPTICEVPPTTCEPPPTICEVPPTTCEPTSYTNVLLRPPLSSKRRRDVSRDGAKEFSQDEIAAVRALANTINVVAQARTLSDRELVLKIATLAHEGQLSEDMLQQALESYGRSAEQGKPIRNPMAWLWATLRNQCWRNSTKLESLLAQTDFPAELLEPPGRGGARVNADGNVELIYTAPRTPT